MHMFIFPFLINTQIGTPTHGLKYFVSRSGIFLKTKVP
uniref:Uncharacterized protein n=1 Tax=Nelumbo nucifera TaxID=4432 RepID=A0A822YU26_NELNU|nr:TPA_asm: hypothetical protein HUJ06_005245 [Nelumbo nucifera]